MTSKQHGPKRSSNPGLGFVPYGVLLLIVSTIVTVDISESHAGRDDAGSAVSTMTTAPTTTVTHGQTMLSIPSARPTITGPALLPVEERGLPG
jgi:hypothetical protein